MPESKPAIEVLRSPEAVIERAASLLLDTAKQAIAERGRFMLALSGGATPAGLYIRLAAPPYELDVEWAKTHIFFSDERCVGPDDRESNFRMANEALLGRAYMKNSKTVHRIKGELGPEKAAEEYEQEMRKAFAPEEGVPRFDLILLGLGSDGHTASLFPGSAALAGTNRLAAPVHEHAPERVTLTFPVINAARNVIFLVTGAAKAAIAAEVLEGGNPGRLPAGLVSPTYGRVIWLLDTRAAAGMDTA